MAKKLVRTSSLTDRFVVGDVTVTPQGVEVTEEQAREIQQRALRNGVRVRVSDIPEQTTPETAEKSAPSGSAKPAAESTKSPAEGDSKKRS